MQTPEPQDVQTGRQSARTAQRCAVRHRPARLEPGAWRAAGAEPLDWPTDAEIPAGAVTVERGGLARCRSLRVGDADAAAALKVRGTMVAAATHLTLGAERRSRAWMDMESAFASAPVIHVGAMGAGLLSMVDAGLGMPHAPIRHLVLGVGRGAAGDLCLEARSGAASEVLADRIVVGAAGAGQLQKADFAGRVSANVSLVLGAERSGHGSASFGRAGVGSALVAGAVVVGDEGSGSLTLAGRSYVRGDVTVARAAGSTGLLAVAAEERPSRCEPGLVVAGNLRLGAGHAEVVVRAAADATGLQVDGRITDAPDHAPSSRRHASPATLRVDGALDAGGVELERTLLSGHGRVHIRGDAPLRVGAAAGVAPGATPGCGGRRFARLTVDGSLHCRGTLHLRADAEEGGADAVEITGDATLEHATLRVELTAAPLRAAPDGAATARRMLLLRASRLRIRGLRVELPDGAAGVRITLLRTATTLELLATPR